MSTIQYSYAEFIEDINELADEIRQNGNAYDVVVGIARGGVVPAVYLSHALNLPFVSASWSSRDGKVGKNIPFDEIVAHGYNVLLVDDMIDSGETIAKVLPVINAVCNVDVAVLWQNSDAAIIATYFSRGISRSADTSWIIYPWETPQ